MIITPIHSRLIGYLKKHQLEKKFSKQAKLFTQDIHHPSLNVELMEPKHWRVYSFRIDKKYRAIFIFHSSEVVEIIDVNNHYS